MNVETLREHVRVEWLILADAAEIVNGKLYLLGGGWQNLMVNQLPFTQPLAIAASFWVPWEETNQVHTVEVEIITADGQSIAKIAGKVEAGRPAGLPAGQAQRVQFAATLAMQIAVLGSYEIRARVDGGQPSAVPFNIIQGPLWGLMQQGAA